MRIEDCTAVVFGGNGLLGRAIVRALRDAGADVATPPRAEADVTDEEQVAAVLDRRRPDLVVNATGYTAVDKAEDDRAAAFILNRTAPALLCRQAARAGAAFVHYSTDFVFDGQNDAPYAEDAPTHPLNVYGESKLAGERAVLGECGNPRALVLRTAWLFGPGKINFVEKMLTLGGERDELRVVGDQIGSPSYTPDLAAYTLALLRKDARGLFHVVNSGHASWCELASEALAVAASECRVESIASEEYPSRAARPGYSVLDTGAFTRATGVTPRPWVQALREYVFQLHEVRGDAD